MNTEKLSPRKPSLSIIEALLWRRRRISTTMSVVACQCNLVCLFSLEADLEVCLKMPLSYQMLVSLAAAQPQQYLVESDRGFAYLYRFLSLSLDPNL